MFPHIISEVQVEMWRRVLTPTSPNSCTSGIAPTPSESITIKNIRLYLPIRHPRLNLIKIFLNNFLPVTLTDNVMIAYRAA